MKHDTKALTAQAAPGAIAHISLTTWSRAIAIIGFIVALLLPFFVKNFLIFQLTLALIYALAMADLTHMLRGNFMVEDRRELAALAYEKGSLFWNTVARSIEARHLALTGYSANSLPMMIAARNAFRSTGANFL